MRFSNVALSSHSVRPVVIILEYFCNQWAIIIDCSRYQLQKYLIMNYSGIWGSRIV